MWTSRQDPGQQHFPAELLSGVGGEVRRLVTQPGDGQHDGPYSKEREVRLEKMRYIAKAIAADLSADPNVLAVWLIGSAARGNIWEGSDIDIQVLVRRVENRFSYRRINDEDVLLKFLTESEIEKLLFEEKSDPALCGFRSSVPLYDRDGILARLKPQAGTLRRTDEEYRHEALERVEEMYEDWHRAVKSHTIGDRCGLSLYLTGTVAGLVGVWFALDKTPMRTYTPYDDVICLLPRELQDRMGGCIGSSETCLETRYRLLEETVQMMTDRVAKRYGQEISRVIGTAPKTYDEVQRALGSGIPRELFVTLSGKGLVSISTRKVRIGPSTFLEEVYSAPTIP